MRKLFQGNNKKEPEVKIETATAEGAAATVENDQKDQKDRKEPIISEVRGN